MTNGWRIARSIETLTEEVERIAPGTRIGTIGDRHHTPPSRHLPGPDSRVRAADIHSNAGLNLEWLVGQITSDPHPAITYLIYRDRAWSPSAGWHDYTGDYHEHVHVAVRDDRADDESPWGLLTYEEDDVSILGLSRGDGYGDDNDPKVRANRRRVTSLQVQGTNAGFGDKLGKAGIDGRYGPATSDTVLAMRRSVGSDVDDGDEIDGWAHGQIATALSDGRAKRHAASGVDLPDSLQVSGELDVGS